MLASSLREYDAQQRLTALAVADAQRVATRGAVAVARSVQTHQAAAVTLSLGALDGLLAEQGIDAAQDAAVNPQALLTDTRSLAGMLGTTTSVAQFAQTFVSDASRTARAVDMATRPAVKGYIRSLTPPSCSRCAVLAGRFYSKSQGFQRHPRCDCLMTPTDEARGKDLATDPMELFEKGQIQGLSKADAEAIHMGADMGQVVNVRRKAASLKAGSSVMVRAGRLTPQGCLSLASDHADALKLLRRYGYIL